MPPLVIDGIPTPVGKMTQTQLPQFIRKICVYGPLLPYSILYQLHSVFLGKKERELRNRHKSATPSQGRHKWTDEQETELKRTFGYVELKKKLPSLREIKHLLKQCPIVNEQFQQGRMTISAVKNKIDRIFRITLV